MNAEEEAINHKLPAGLQFRSVHPSVQVTGAKQPGLFSKLFTVPNPEVTGLATVKLPVARRTLGGNAI